MKSTVTIQAVALVSFEETLGVALPFQMFVSLAVPDAAATISALSIRLAVPSRAGGTQSVKGSFPGKSGFPCESVVLRMAASAFSHDVTESTLPPPESLFDPDLCVVEKNARPS